MAGKGKKPKVRLPKGFNKVWVKGERDETGSLVGGRGGYLGNAANNVMRLKPAPRERRQLPARVVQAKAKETNIVDVERRVLRACRTIRCLPDRERRFLGQATNSMWQNVVHDFHDAYGANIALSRFNPKPADVSDCLVALRWCNCLERHEFQLVWWRSFDLSFGVIAANIGRSDETARTRYLDAMKKVWFASLEEAPA